MVRVAVGISAALVLWAPSALGDADLEAQRDARSAMKQAVLALETGDHETALARCRHASELVPEANLPHKCAARALEGLGRWAEAIEEYETYLRIKGDVSDAAVIRAKIDDLQARHLTGTIRLVCIPERISVRVDGKDVALNADRELRLPAGPHRLHVHAPGFQVRELDVEIAPEKVAAPSCSLERERSPRPPLFTPITPPPKPETPTQHRSPWYGQWWVWTGAGAVVAGSIISVILLAPRSSSPPATEGGNHPFPP